MTTPQATLLIETTTTITTTAEPVLSSEIQKPNKENISGMVGGVILFLIIFAIFIISSITQFTLHCLQTNTSNNSVELKLTTQGNETTTTTTTKPTTIAQEKRLACE